MGPLTATQSVLGKYHALRTLLTMIMWFDNWSDTWGRYRSGVDLPPLRFRSGLVIRHRSEDQPLLQFYEVFRQHNYRRYITEHKQGVMIDIGANIGFVTLDWAVRLPNVCVHAYEPHPATFAMLRANVDMNCPASRVKLYQEAVGRDTGIVALRASALSMGTTAYHSATPARKFDEFSAPVIALDQVIERCEADGPVRLVKIDAEGAEADILEGAQPETLIRIRQFVIEYHDFLCPNALVRCKRRLVDAGFSCIERPANATAGLLYALR